MHLVFHLVVKFVDHHMVLRGRALHKFIRLVVLDLLLFHHFSHPLLCQRVGALDIVVHALILSNYFLGEVVELLNQVLGVLETNLVWTKSDNILLALELFVEV